ncbi:zinc finger protein 84-like [Macrobrachium rosenbergii]|uniref:zinc finger protein 84-like n=1 Tax=Macrobrachium rosenbergii TaxID=79674 RepID=UPI0034D78690
MEQLKVDDPLGISLTEPSLDEEGDTPGTASSSFERTFECPNCGKSFAYRKRFIIHMEQCAGKIADAKQSTKVHKKPLSVSSKEKTDEFKCPMCDKVFNQKADLNCHLTSHSQDKPYECIECGRRFSRKEYLIRHIPIHSCEKVYTCPICNYQVSRPDRYKLHMKSHGVSNPFKCSLCGQGFPGLKGLNKHLNSHNSSALDPGANTSSYQGVGLCTFNCVECGITFEKAEKYKQHMLKHGVEEPYECSLCGDSFASKLHLNRHLSNHNSVLQARAEVSQKCMSKVNEVSETIELSNHMNVNPYKKFTGVNQTKAVSKANMRDSFNSSNSDIMNLESGDSSSVSEVSKMTPTGSLYTKVFPDSSSKSRNEIKVSNNEVAPNNKVRVSEPESDHSPGYNCTLCRLQFSSKIDYLEHMKVQHNKLYACQKCGKSYTRKSNLKKHPCGDRRSRGSFECTTCGISFPSVKELDDHIISHISGTSEPAPLKDEFEVNNANASNLCSGGSSQYINTDISVTPDLPKKKKKLKHKIIKSMFERGGDVTYEQNEIFVDDQIASYLTEGIQLVKKKKKLKNSSNPSEPDSPSDQVPMKKMKPKPKSPLQVLDMIESELSKFQSNLGIPNANKLEQEKSASEYEKLVLFEYMTMNPVLPEVDHSVQDTIYDVVQVNDQLSMKFFM